MPKPIIPKRRPMSWRRKAILATAAVALVAGAVAVVAPWGDEPADVTREFLAAVRAKDLDRAYELAEGDRPEATGRERFVDPTALRDDWQVGEVTETSRRENHGWEEAFVRYELTGPDGLRGEGSLKVYRGDSGSGSWIVAYPLVTVHISPSPLRYVDVNAVHVSREYARYHLLPGLYEFYARDSSPYVREKGGPRFVTGRGERHTSMTVEHGGAFEDSVWPAIETATAANIHSCAQQAVPEPPNCPFGTSEPIFSYPDFEVTGIEDVRWTVEELPHVQPSLEPGTLPRFDSLRVSFAIPPDRSVAGKIELAATGLTADGDRVAFTADCGVYPGFLVWAVEENGEVVVEDLAGGRAPSPSALPSTCLEVNPA